MSGGGAEKVLATLVRHIDREQFHVTVCHQIHKHGDMFSIEKTLEAIEFQFN